MQKSPSANDALLAKVRQRLATGPAPVADLPAIRDLIAKGQGLEALRIAREECERRGGDPALAYWIGAAAVIAGRPAEGESWLETAVAADPDNVTAHLALAYASGSLGNLDARATHYARAIDLSPVDPDLRARWSEALLDIGDAQGAEREARAGLDMAPGHVPSTVALARALSATGRAERAVGLLRDRLAVGEHIDLRWQLAHACLAAGRFAEGFDAFEVRKRPRSLGDKGAIPAPELPHPEWTGDSLAGRRLLVVSEQGLGDNLFAMRYAAQLAASGELVSIVAPEALVRLLRAQDFPHEVFAMGEPIPRAAYDCWCFSLSLPRLLGESGNRARAPYIAAPRSKGASAAKEKGVLVVGLCWAGNARNPHDFLRSIDVENFAAIADVPGVALVSCQFGADALPSFIAPPPRRIADLADTAALIAQFDLLISVDTAPAHLAGAMGRPVWALARWFPDWRLLGADGQGMSRWYPSMRIFRQPQAGDWATTLKVVSSALSQLTHES